MDFVTLSRSLLPLLGGRENIASAAHCATRMRLVLVDDAKPTPLRLASWRA